MTATNHVATGAVIGATITLPALAIPVAFLAHFVLDALPHFGFSGGHTSKRFVRFLICDMTLAALVLLAIIVLQPTNWPLLFACGVACASPDLMWLPRWIMEMRGKDPGKMGPIARFHAVIQWGERSWGIYIEAVWLAVMVYLLFSLG